MPVGLQREGLGECHASCGRFNDAELVDALLVPVVAHLAQKSMQSVKPPHLPSVNVMQAYRLKIMATGRPWSTSDHVSYEKFSQHKTRHSEHICCHQDETRLSVELRPMCIPSQCVVWEIGPFDRFASGI